jgi:hypothetical protein
VAELRAKPKTIDSDEARRLLRHGIAHLRVIEKEMAAWLLREHEYESVEQLQGSLSHKNCPDPVLTAPSNARRYDSQSLSRR